MVIEPLSSGEEENRAISLGEDEKEPLSSTEDKPAGEGERRVICVNCGHAFTRRGSSKSRPQCSKCRSYAVQPRMPWLRFVVDATRRLNRTKLEAFRKVYGLLRDQGVFDHGQPTIDQMVRGFARFHHTAERVRDSQSKHGNN